MHRQLWFSPAITKTKELYYIQNVKYISHTLPEGLTTLLRRYFCANFMICTIHNDYYRHYKFITYNNIHLNAIL